MDIFYHPDHSQHAPEGFMTRGTRVASPETPERASILLDAVTSAGHRIITAGKPELEPVRRVHDAGYLEFLETAWRQWIRLPDHGPEIIPNTHPNRNMDAKPDLITGLAGYYQADCACPIGPGTWPGVLQSAQTAVDAARHVLGGAHDYSYALCRPPGHHAYADMAGGFCFLNNSAIAAQHCRDAGHARVLILDVDVHHGNGTQGIFYERSDVMTISLHGDPASFYPFYAGHANETGFGDGEGFNINVPLAKGTDDDDFMQALLETLTKVVEFSPDVLVVALGLDASEHDPLAFLGITTQGFAGIGRNIANLGLPTVLVQEGGYISDVLGDNLAAFLNGFESGYQQR